MSSSRPIARRTWLGSGSADEQAEPELTAMSRIAIIRASPSTSRKAEVQVTRQAIAGRTVEPDARDASGDPLVQSFPQLEQPACLVVALAHRDLGRQTEPHNQRHRHRPAPQPALVPPAVDERFEPDLGIAAANVKSADPFGTVNLVRGQAEQVDDVGLDVERYLADRLGGIGVEHNAAIVTEPADLGDRIDRPDFVVGGHDRYQDRPLGQCVGDGRGRNASIFVARNDRDLPALPRQPLERVENRLVLGGGRHEMIAAPGRGPRDSLDRQVVRFGCPRREDDLTGFGADGPGDLCSRTLDGLGRLRAKPMRRRWPSCRKAQ